MKLKVYIVKKQQLIWAAIVLLIIIVSAILIISIKAQQTISNVTPAKTYHVDLDNDGKSDSIILNTDSDTGKYSVTIMSPDGIAHSLEADPAIKTLGYFSKDWPIKITLEDINNDGTSEVILQSSDQQGPILHIFKYANGETERIASGRYSFYGTFKSPVDKSNILMLGSKNNSEIKYTYLSTKFGKLYPYMAPSSLNLGKTVISNIVSYIEKMDVETSSMDAENKHVSKLSKGSFLDCLLTSAKYYGHEIPSECSYIMRTKSISNNNENLVTYKITLKLSKYDTKKPEYKITSINIIK
ncbi:hypothetical protein Q428_09335 [Fervidicella metallireducens AeB]|uniref:VCBS repeat-containing protein n=1 Tax=Fervidicella metallireducens AeB TaxID=1403537 RepID=A0A017RU89_9CLOT|nr:hypothetical protein [Fervidicella metallireducens]EYE88161.1 hypothetical protein Q428_09335 [Fervidicella metallireducens AeB]